MRHKGNAGCKSGPTRRTRDPLRGKRGTCCVEVPMESCVTTGIPDATRDLRLKAGTQRVALATYVVLMWREKHVSQPACKMQIEIHVRAQRSIAWRKRHVVWTWEEKSCVITGILGAKWDPCVEIETPGVEIATHVARMWRGNHVPEPTNLMHVGTYVWKSKYALWRSQPMACGCGEMNHVPQPTCKMQIGIYVWKS